jgi:hypothetical protein
MTIDLGSTFEAPGQLLPGMRLLTSDTDKARGFLYNCARWLNTPRGSVWYAKNRGLDMRQFVCDSENPRIAEQAINGENLKDERCSRSVTAITVGADGSWTVTTNIYAQDGTVFTLVFLVTESSVSVLRGLV